jgi:hypothetical protein
VASASRRLDMKGAIGLAGDGDLRHATTLASLQRGTAGRSDQAWLAAAPHGCAARHTAATISPVHPIPVLSRSI